MKLVILYCFLLQDVYQNLSLKTLSAFEWFLTFCPGAEFLLKDCVFSMSFLIDDNISSYWLELMAQKERYVSKECSEIWKITAICRIHRKSS